MRTLVALNWHLVRTLCISSFPFCGLSTSSRVLLQYWKWPLATEKHVKCACQLEKELRVFLGVAKSIVGLLLFFGVGIIQRLFNILYYVRWLHLSATPRNYQIQRTYKTAQLTFCLCFGPFLFPKLPPDFTNQNILKVFVLLIFILQTNKDKQKWQIFLNIYIK